MLIFELSQSERQARAQAPKARASKHAVPSAFQRATPPKLPACSELQVVRHFT
ncbi:MAG: aminomethyl-transferring glycine dehydrogenase subunit GcvPB, partial [Legionella sp.]